MTESHDETVFTPSEMHLWVQGEITEVMKGAELRVKELTSLANAFSAGKLSAEEAETLMIQYKDRWEEALPGIHLNKGMSDEEIVGKIDEARASDEEWRAKSHRERNSAKSVLPGPRPRSKS